MSYYSKPKNRRMHTFVVGPDGKRGLRCLKIGLTSFREEDVRAKYCPACSEFVQVIQMRSN